MAPQPTAETEPRAAPSAAPPGPRCGGLPYTPRRPEDGVLHRVVREHLETFLAEARERNGGDGLPHFVERELRDFLACGQLGRGFARFRCDECKNEILVAFSCKARAVCPSCSGRRMAEIAAHLTDNVLGGLPVRQWVLTLPHRLRYALAWDHELCRAVLAVFVRALLGFERRRAARRGIRGGQGGTVTAIQRFGSAVNLNVHLHTLAVQGVFVEHSDGRLCFVPSPAPSDRDVARLLASIRARVVRLVKRRGIVLDQPGDDVDRLDPLAEESPALAGLCGASVAGRVAIGPRSGQPVLRIGRDPDALWVTSSGPCHAHLEGFDLHADVAVGAGARVRLEHLCRYVLRPPVAQDALELFPDGRVLLKIRRPWHDGTRAILFEPLDFLARLAAVIPKPRINLVLYHGVFGPHARLRAQAVAGARDARQASVADPAEADVSVAQTAATLPGPAEAPPEPALPSPPGPAAEPPSLPPRPAPPESMQPARRSSARGYRWADLMRRTLDIDVLACPGCGGRLRLIATIDDPVVIKKILAHLGLPTGCPEALPARSPPMSLFDRAPA